MANMTSKGFLMLFILRFKVKSCLTLCRYFIGNTWPQNSHNKTKCYHFISSKQFNDVIDMKTKNNS